MDVGLLHIYHTVVLLVTAGTQPFNGKAMAQLSNSLYYTSYCSLISRADRDVVAWAVLYPIGTAITKLRV